MARILSIDIDRAVRSINYEPDGGEKVPAIELVAVALSLLEYVSRMRLYEGWRRVKPGEVRLVDSAIADLTAVVRKDESWS